MPLTPPRRTRSEEFKLFLIEAFGEPEASVAGVALANGINANQLRRWMRERGIEPPELSCLPLRVAASEPIGGLVPVPLSPRIDPPIQLELRKGAAVVTVDWPASSTAACGVTQAQFDTLVLGLHWQQLPCSCCRIGSGRSQPEARSRGDHWELTLQAASGHCRPRKKC